MAELWPGGPIELPHEFTIDDVELTIPEIPTATLFGWLSAGAWWSLFPESVPPASLLVLTMRFIDDQDRFDYENLWEPAITLFARLAGTAPRDGVGTGWWPALRLAASAAHNWPVYTAWCAGRGTDPLGGPLWQVIGSVYGWLRDSRAGNPDELAKLDQLIWGPPPVTGPSAPEELPRHVRDEEAALALAALSEVVPGQERVSEWTKPSD